MKREKIEDAFADRLECSFDTTSDSQHNGSTDHLGHGPKLDEQIYGNVCFVKQELGESEEFVDIDCDVGGSKHENDETQIEQPFPTSLKVNRKATDYTESTPVELLNSTVSFLTVPSHFWRAVQY